MKRTFAGRLPSPAMAVALAALFVALGGTSYAAFSLPSNSVGTKQLKNGAVTTKKIKNGAVTGSKIQLGTLGTVPSARHATTASAAPPTGAAGGDLTGSYPNPSLANGSVTPSKLGTIPAAGVFSSTNQSVADSSNVVLPFDGERYDTDGLHNTTSPSRLTAPIAGVYEVSASVTWENNSSGYRYLQLALNGSTLLATSEVGAAPSGAYTQQTVSQQVKLNAGDYVEVVVVQTSGSTLDVLSQPERSPEFQMTWLAPA